MQSGGTVLQLHCVNALLCSTPLYPTQFYATRMYFALLHSTLLDSALLCATLLESTLLYPTLLMPCCTFSITECAVLHGIAGQAHRHVGSCGQGTGQVPARAQQARQGLEQREDASPTGGPAPHAQIRRASCGHHPAASAQHWRGEGGGTSSDPLKAKALSAISPPPWEARLLLLGRPGRGH